MEKTLRRLFAVLAIGGSTTAIVVLGVQLWDLAGFLTKLVLFLYFLVAIGGIYAGILLLEGDARADRYNLYFWLSQAPIFFLPGLGHKLGIGAFLFLWVELPLRANAFWGLGANLQFRVFKIEPPVAIGVNLVALGLAAWFYRRLRAATPEADSLLDAAVAPTQDKMSEQTSTS